MKPLKDILEESPETRVRINLIESIIVSISVSIRSNTWWKVFVDHGNCLWEYVKWNL